MSDMVNKISERLTQEEIEEGLSAILHEPFPQRSQIGDIISKELLIKFLIYGTELLRQEPMLIEFEFNNRCAVVGDLHGNINDLIGIIYEAGIPPRSNFLFLGDYVGRGDCQLDVFIAVLLLKFRWPTYVYMLRGNHECIDQSEDDGFEKACLDAYNDELIFKLFGQLFDYMPVAAIVNNQALCCHGGISQWMISRDAIRNIPRPTGLTNMKMLENCLLTDILWADPESNQKEAFLPSKRGVSYTFNEKALKDVFFYLRCTLLIRGHKWVEGGIYEEFKDICYTVHTTALLDVALAPAFIVLKLEGHKGDRYTKLVVDVTKNASHTFSADYSDALWTDILATFLQRAYKRNPIKYLETFNYKKVLDYMNIAVAEDSHNISHVQMTKWTLRYAPHIFKALRESTLFGQSYIHAELFPKYFPLMYDIMYGSGYSFRIRVTAEEKETIKKILNINTAPDNPLPFEEWPIEPYNLDESSDPSLPNEY